MVAIPYIFNEINQIFQNTPYYATFLEISLLILVIWLILYNKNHLKNARPKYTLDQQTEIINNYKPKPLVPLTTTTSISDSDKNHLALNPRLVYGKAGKRINVEGNDCLNLATHNYLGFIDNEQIQQDAIKSLRKYGVGSCGPRGFYGTVDVHLELEERLAKFMKMEEAIVYSYGFSTIASAIPAYAKKNDIIFVDEKVNFAIQKGLDASRSTIYYFKHNDIVDLEKLLKEQELRDRKNPKKAAKTKRFLVVEGIFMNSGEICPLPDLITLRKKYKLRLFLDESISFGTMGQYGRGLTEHFNVNTEDIDFISAGLEWAVGSIGGFCVGSSYIIEHQRLSGLGYCFSASLPPLLTQAAISALNYFENTPSIFQEIQECSKKLHQKLIQLPKMQLTGNEISPIKHLFIKNNENLTIDDEIKLLTKIVNMCIENGLAIVETQYLDDVEKHHPRHSLRITANRLLTDDDLNLAFEILQRVIKSVLE